MVQIMFESASPQAEWDEVMQGPREVIATVIFRGDPDTENHKHPCSQAMTVKEDRIGRDPEAHGDQLPGRLVLRGKAKGLTELMVDGMEVAVEPLYFVVQNMPQVVLEIKQDGARQDAKHKLGQARCFFRQRCWWPPVPLTH